MITITGFLTALFLGYNLYKWLWPPASQGNLYAINNKQSLVFMGSMYLLALVIYVIEKFYRKSQGIELKAIYQEDPGRVRSTGYRVRRERPVGRSRFVSERSRACAGARRPTRLFFAADLHGSEPTFRKFVNAAAFYGTDVLVFGGDIMGKALVPIVRTDGNYLARLDGLNQEFDEDGRAAFIRSVERQGFYWKVMERDEYTALKDDPLARLGLFQELAKARLEAWLDLAEERLAGTGVTMYLTGGNDDEPSVLDALEEHDGERVIACEGRLIELDDEHTMITVGLSTVTPWDTPREASEGGIAAAIDAELAKVRTSPVRLQLPLSAEGHADRHLSEARVETRQRPAADGPEGGRFLTTAGGSQSVRDASSKLLQQPLVGLHGHIHESGGRFRIGRTQAFNPGSEYVQGALQGWIVHPRGPAARLPTHIRGLMETRTRASR